ncbi:MAG TPA: ATP-binding protein [Terriglobales bacterium]|nr:ATP-binding protein [Terriglobales bacterium]
MRDNQRRIRRRTAAILLAVPAFVLLTFLFSQQAFNLTFLRPDSSSQALVFAALSAFVFLLFLLLCLMLARILLKLAAERRGGVMGSKFRTKLVSGALALSFGPVLFLFLFAYGLMNRSIDKWFSSPIEEVRRDTTTIATTLAEYTLENARAEAVSLAVAPETEKAFQTGKFGPLLDEFRRRDAPLQGGFALALLDSELEASYQIPTTWPQLAQKLRISSGSLSLPTSIQIDRRQFLIGWQEVGRNGMIIVGMSMPPNFTRAVAQMEQSQQGYLSLANERKRIRLTYMMLLLLITSVVLFAATWLAVFLSKFVTTPVAALATGTQELSKGNLDYRVQVPATDELGELVGSFNRMAEELKSNRLRLETSRLELAEANTELDQRRRHIEIVLENIPTGVLSLDAIMRVTHANAALTRLFRPDSNGSSSAILRGSHIRDIFPQDLIDDLAHMLRKADRMSTATSQLEAVINGRTLSLAVTVASLKHEAQRLGYVVVFEDLTDLLKAQKQAAWREVARRVAHEIKNPLTPIALSAQRIKRHLERGSAPDDASLAVIHGCAETIAGAVETVRTLVDEFSTMARFPAAQVRPSDINNIVHTALSMFDGRLEGVTVRTFLSPELPKVMADPEAMKRALANLVDNAAEAMRDSLVREIQITTSVLSTRDMVEVVIADSGHGITAEAKEKLFLPYFSTKGRGTGLGLAIVSRIVEDHHGSIRIEENRPVGTKFIVELPVATESSVETAAHA